MTTVAVVALAGGAVLLLQPSYDHNTVDPRTHVYANYTACLLTGPGGTSTEPAASIWKGMQQASASTNERATNQAIIGAQNTQNIEQYINTLASLKCRAIITTGQNAAQAALNRAPAWPRIYLIAVAAGNSSNLPGNFHRINEANNATISSDIAQALINNYNSNNGTGRPTSP